MTPQEQRNYELGRIRYSIEHYKDMIARYCKLIRHESDPEDSALYKMVLRNDIFMLKRHVREYGELLKQPLEGTNPKK